MSKTKRYTSDDEEDYGDAMDDGGLDTFLSGLSTEGYGKTVNNNQSKNRKAKLVKSYLFKRDSNGKTYYPYEDNSILSIMENTPRFSKYSHGFYTMPDKSQYFCTNCMGTMNDTTHREEHVRKCGRTSTSGEWCLICNIKCGSPNEARAHFNSSVHHARRIFIKSFLANGGKYYITNKSASTTMPSDIDPGVFHEYGVIIDFSEVYQERLTVSDSLYEKYKKSSVEQLATLMSQMIDQKKNSTGTQVDMVIRNRLIILIDGLLSEINTGTQHCHLVTTDDFVNSSNLLQAIKLILVHGVNNAATSTRDAKMKQLEDVFSIREGADFYCHICEKTHSVQQYTNRRYLFGAIRAIKNQIV